MFGRTEIATISEELSLFANIREPHFQNMCTYVNSTAKIMNSVNTT